MEPNWMTFSRWAALCLMEKSQIILIREKSIYATDIKFDLMTVLVIPSVYM